MDGRLIALQLLGLGWYVAICVVVGAVGGVWLDKVSGLTPLFTLLGVLLGTVAAFFGLFKMVRPLFNNDSTTGKTGSDGDTSQ